MRICLTCRNASPVDALFCLNCGRSFGGRICDKHHRSPAASRYCIACGSSDLSRSTRSLDTGCLFRVIGWLLVVVCLKLLLENTGAIFSFLSTIAMFVFGGLIFQLGWLVVVWLATWLLLRLTLGDNSQVTKGYLAISRRVGSWFVFGLTWTIKTLVRLILGEKKKE